MQLQVSARKCVNQRAILTVRAERDELDGESGHPLDVNIEVCIRNQYSKTALCGVMWASN